MLQHGIVPTPHSGQLPLTVATAPGLDIGLTECYCRYTPLNSLSINHFLINLNNYHSAILI